MPAALAEVAPASVSSSATASEAGCRAVRASSSCRHRLAREPRHSCVAQVAKQSSRPCVTNVLRTEASAAPVRARLKVERGEMLDQLDRPWHRRDVMGSDPGVIQRVFFNRQNRGGRGGHCRMMAHDPAGDFLGARVRRRRVRKRRLRSVRRRAPATRSSTTDARTPVRDVPSKSNNTARSIKATPSLVDRPGSASCWLLPATS